MGKIPWYMKVLMLLRVVSAKVEDGTIGPERKQPPGVRSREQLSMG
jgi:hypothetical protein